MSLVSELPTASAAVAMSMTSQPDEGFENMKNLLFVSQTVLQQAVDILDKHFTADDQLTVHSQYLPGSTIGKHLRHARDHFELLLNCISTPPPYVLNYDVRIRNTPMETSRMAARDALLRTIDRLGEIIPSADCNAKITLNAVTPFSQTFESTFGRELWFAGLHCVHHWSMVRVIAGEMNIKLAHDFGFAPSTLVHQGREVPLGKAKI